MKTTNKLCANTSCTQVQDFQNHSCIVPFSTAIYSAGLETWLPGHQLMNEGSDPSDIYTKIHIRSYTVVARKNGKANHQHSGKMWENHLSLIWGNYVCASKGAYFQNKRIQSKETHDKTWYFGGVPLSIPFLCKPRLDFEPIEPTFFTFYMFWSNKTIVRNHICSQGQLSRWSLHPVLARGFLKGARFKMLLGRWF